MQRLPGKRNTYKFKFIEKFKEKYSIKLMCEELEISRDSYYKWLKRKDSKNRYEINHDSLKPLIQYYYDLSNSTAGYRQIKDQLQEHEGIVISYYMAYILKCKTMKLNAVRESSKNKGKYRVTTKDNEQKYTYQNIAENIEIDDIGKVISTDTTEVKLEKDGKQNISFFIDAYSSEILVSVIGKSLSSDFIEYNLDLLSKSNYNLNNVVLHSDRGSMYKSGIYKTKTAEMNLIPSMSAPYTCTHNPWIETLNGQFKDFIKNNYPKNLDELQIVLNKFVYYNNNIKIKKKLKTTPTKYRCCHS
ncbi:MAG: IS3 family transposase [Candidatus Coprovivens sp.]